MAASILNMVQFSLNLTFACESPKKFCIAKYNTNACEIHNFIPTLAQKNHKCNRSQSSNKIFQILLAFVLQIDQPMLKLYDCHLVFHCKRCGVIYDTVQCLPHLFWCNCQFHSIIYYTNGVVSTLHFYSVVLYCDD